ncbi:MAG: branched-chain amino acid aminotransferase [Bacteriovoracaceae bacterium]
MNITQEAKDAISNFKLPEEVGFGQVLAPVMAICDYDNGKWGDLQIVPYGPINLFPTAKVFHYAQEIFEGMKAYKADGKGPFLFRPLENFNRFNFSAKRMAIPEISEEIFMGAVNTIVSLCGDFIPEKAGSSLYIRPFTFATEENLGIKPSQKFKFMVVASPSATYYSAGAMSVLIQREMVRAFPGGTGAAKTGGNYAGSLLSNVDAAQMGYMNSLWLDAKEHSYIEELSGMNFFAVYGNELVTPPVSDTILDGITRKSLVDLAELNGMQVTIRKIHIDELLEDIKAKRCTEAFACGTAAIITPIEYFGDKNGEKYTFDKAPGEVSMQLRNMLLDIQEGRKQGPEGWVIKID